MVFCSDRMSEKVGEECDVFVPKCDSKFCGNPFTSLPFSHAKTTNSDISAFYLKVDSRAWCYLESKKYLLLAKG